MDGACNIVAAVWTLHVAICGVPDWHTKTPNSHNAAAAAAAAAAAVFARFYFEVQEPALANRPYSKAVTVSHAYYAQVQPTWLGKQHIIRW